MCVCLFVHVAGHAEGVGRRGEVIAYGRVNVHQRRRTAASYTAVSRRAAARVTKRR